MFAQKDLIAETENLRKFALHLTRNKSDADDLVQSTFLRALEKADYFEDGTSLRKWTSKIMFNLFVTDYRRKTRFETQYDPEPYIQAQAIGAPQESKAELHAVGDAMVKLSPDHQEILTMVCINDMPYQEVADALDIPVGTVRSRLSRARESLNGLLETRNAAPYKEFMRVPGFIKHSAGKGHGTHGHTSYGKLA